MVENQVDNEQVQQFLAVKNSRELASVIGINYSSLIFSLGFLKSVKVYPRYVDFQIPKKNGELRKISAPNKSLLFAQRNLVILLSAIYKTPKAVHGFIKTQSQNQLELRSKSIVSNAKQHKKRNIILNIDLKDFFPSINSRRVFSLFTKQPFYFNKQVAGIITEICVHDLNKNLPQGAATSPIISNMICYRLDKKLTKLSADNNVVYTRYADDLTFSSSKNNIDDFKAKVIDEIKKEGFEINRQKLRQQNRTMRQEVTGLIVNEKVNVERKYIRRIRAMLHNWEVKGLEQCQKEMLLKYKKKHMKQSLPDFQIVLKGMIDFMGQVRGKNESEDKFNLYQKYLLRFYKLKHQKDQDGYNRLLEENKLASKELLTKIDDKTSEEYDLNDIIPFLE